MQRYFDLINEWERNIVESKQMETKMIEIWTNNRVPQRTHKPICNVYLKGYAAREGGWIIIKWMGALQLTTKILNKGVTNHRSPPTNPLLIGLEKGFILFWGCLLWNNCERGEGGGGGVY